MTIFTNVFNSFMKEIILGAIDKFINKGFEQ